MYTDKQVKINIQDYLDKYPYNIDLGEGVGLTYPSVVNPELSHKRVGLRFPFKDIRGHERYVELDLELEYPEDIKQAGEPVVAVLSPNTVYTTVTSTKYLSHDEKRLLQQYIEHDVYKYYARNDTYGQEVVSRIYDKMLNILPHTENFIPFFEVIDNHLRLMNLCNIHLRDSEEEIWSDNEPYLMLFEELPHVIKARYIDENVRDNERIKDLFFEQADNKSEWIFKGVKMGEQGELLTSIPKMANEVYKVVQTIHESNGIELLDGRKEFHDMLRKAVTNNYMPSDEYKLSKRAGAFLQGQEDSKCWTLVEFWGKDYQPFVDFLNAKAQELDNTLLTQRVQFVTSELSYQQDKISKQQDSILECWQNLEKLKPEILAISEQIYTPGKIIHN